MALDHTHPGGPVLAQYYLDIMLGNAAPPALGLPFAAPAAPGAPAVTTWQQVEWVLNQMWWDYDTFVYSCKPAFKIHRVLGARSLDLRKRWSLRRRQHRGIGKPAAAAVRQFRASLLGAYNTLIPRCYDPPAQPIFYFDSPPSMPPGSMINLAPLDANDKRTMADALQDFRDRMSIAVSQVHAYIGILEKDAQRRQAWFDNAIKLVSAVSALGGALAPL
ncbi:hypothetical protein IQ07DRAFT_601079 [Pyrenochaeta sp. DS3sAY3a]|nr:hypothetical protein IQ07DRAFT_601079 [Pyrenochaeta sp. DS3sAY3a]